MLREFGQIWGNGRSTLGAKSEQSTRAVIKTQKKVTLDGYDFMRITGDFEVYNDESKEVEKVFKYIGYCYIKESRRTEEKRNNIIYWCEGFSDERGDYNSIEETADKIMSTFKMSDEYKEYFAGKKA